MNKTLHNISRSVFWRWVNFYTILIRIILRVLLVPFRLFSRSSFLRLRLDYHLHTSIKEIFSKELDKSTAPITLEENFTSPRLTAVDLGSRGGPIEEIQKNKLLFDHVILCEGEPKEALRLRSEGYVVIDKFVGGKAGTAKFHHVTQNPGASSLKRPCTKFLEVYGGRDYYKNHLEFEESDVALTDLSTELIRININQVDLLKLDIQGYEYEVLSSIMATEFRPLVIHCEVMQVPFYFDTRYGCEIDTLLLRAHYFCIRRSDEHFRGGMPFWCDKIYIPNLMRKEGRKIIESRMDGFLLLSKMYRFENLAQILLTSSGSD